jgi:predicted DNA-binding protein (MmcQ/YjbR family)
MKYSEIDKYLLSFDSAWRDFPFGAKKSVYKVGDAEDAKMFAIVDVDSKPLRISLRTDTLLAQNLRERYDEVQPGDHLDRKRWITIVNSGQLSDEEIHDLARLSHRLASDEATL